MSIFEQASEPCWECRVNCGYSYVRQTFVLSEDRDGYLALLDECLRVGGVVFLLLVNL